MIYKCKECGAVFDEPQIIKTTHGGRYEAHGYEKYDKCPNCPSDDFIECVICDYCGEAVADDIDDYVYFREKEENICNDCLHDYCVDNYSHTPCYKPEGFSERLTKLRKLRGLTQRELAKQTGISQPTICHYESGKIFPSILLVIDIANFFGVSADYLLGG